MQSQATGGFSKALSLPFELLVQTSLSPQSEMPAKRSHFIQFHQVSMQSCKSVPGWHRGSRRIIGATAPPPTPSRGEQTGAAAEQVQKAANVKPMKEKSFFSLFFFLFFCPLMKRTVTPEVSQPFSFGLQPQISCQESPLKQNRSYGREGHVLQPTWTTLESLKEL